MKMKKIILILSLVLMYLPNIFSQTAKYSVVCGFSEGLAAVKRDKLWGYIDKTGKEVIPCTLKYANDFHEGVAYIGEYDGGYFIDKQGKTIFSLEPEYKIAGEFSSGRLLVAHEAEDDTITYGFLNRKGEWVIPCIFDFAYPFSDDGITFVTTYKWMRTVIDTLGNVVGKGELYFNHLPFSEGLAMVSSINFETDEEYWWGVDKHQNPIIDYGDFEPYYYSEEMSVVKDKNEMFGFMDKFGKLVIPCNYDKAYSFSDGLAMVKKGNYWGAINKKGKVVIPIEYESISDFSEGVAIVKKNGLYGFMDQKAKLIIPCKYKKAWSFSEGLAIVESDDDFMYIDKKEQVVLSFPKK